MPEFGKKLGQILLGQGQISAPKLRLALQQQSLHPCPLGELLVSKKWYPITILQKPWRSSRA
tara:strand:+ start:24 stop:209 length:186 start_codon:yes stop_codon:yes gene_type:complete